MGKRESGFTLIEIAIVLVIIGLLLGGVLKGQELITGARVRSFIQQQDGVKAAYFGFLDRYRALPGDYSQANANIPNMGAVCNTGGVGGNGNGNGQIEIFVRLLTRTSWSGNISPNPDSSTVRTLAPPPPARLHHPRIPTDLSWICGSIRCIREAAEPRAAITSKPERRSRRTSWPRSTAKWTTEMRPRVRSERLLLLITHVSTRTG